MEGEQIKYVERPASRSMRLPERAIWDGCRSPQPLLL